MMTALERADRDYLNALTARSDAQAALDAAQKTLMAARERLDEAKRQAAPPVDRSQQQLASGAPVPEDRSHTETRENGQQKDYVVLSPEERAKGFVRPVRDAYRHVGTPGQIFPLRDLTDEERERFGGDYAKYELYPPGHRGTALGHLWTQANLDKVGKGCGHITTMGRSIAETYARDPHFYSGTFCTTCRNHFPVGERGEFVWVENDGSEGPRVGT